MELKVSPSINFKLNPNNRLLIKGITSGLRRTVRGLRQDVSKKVRERYTVQLRAVTQTIKTKASGLTAELGSKGSVISLRKYKTNPRKRLRRQPANGIFAQVVRGQGGYLRHAFSTYRGGVFERVGKSRLPIRGVTGPSAPGMLNSVPVSSFVMKRVNERLNININHELNYYLSNLF